MSKKPKPKRAGVRALLDLLGADPNEAAPTGLREAEWRADEAGGGEKHVSLEKCPVSQKVMFSSESAAKAAARRRLNKGSNTNSLRTYRCPDCGAHHFTSSFRS